MPKRRQRQQTDLQLPKHAAAIAAQAEGNLGIASAILIPIVLDVISKLLPVLMNCGQDKTPAERLGYDLKTGEFKPSAMRRAVAQVRRSARAQKVVMEDFDIQHTAILVLHEAVRPTTDLAMCAAECAAV